MSDTETTVIANPPAVATEPTEASKSETPVEKPEEMRKAPNPRCKKCFGRGHVGHDAVRGGEIPCRCTFSDKEESLYKHHLREEERKRSLSRK